MRHFCLAITFSNLWTWSSFNSAGGSSPTFVCAKGINLAKSSARAGFLKAPLPPTRTCHGKLRRVLQCPGIDSS